MHEIMINEAVTELQSIQDLLRWTVTQFNLAPLYYGHGTDNSWDEAVQLVLAGLSLPFDTPPALYSARLTRTERQRLIEWVIRRVEQRVPVAYLTNTAWFCGLSFYVDERVLVPRSPIGELIDKRFLGHLVAEPQRILDMCTGSGCIAIACAYAYPEAEIDAVDCSVDALAVAEHNIQTHGLEQQVTPLCSDLFANLIHHRYDLIIANPPYVDSAAMAELPPEYRHEPILGLAAGCDGLQLVHRLLVESVNYLNNDAILICEVGDSRAQLEAQYPYFPFTWLALEHGGHGVFMLTRQQLSLLGNSDAR